MKIYVNKELENKETSWEAKNGATRRHLKVINKAGVVGKKFQASLGTLNKGNHSFIFINPEKSGQDDRTVGIYLNGTYSYEVVESHSPENPIIFENYSAGGYGNSCSKFGIYKMGTMIMEHSYKHRHGDTFFKLTHNGWECLGDDIPLDNSEIEEV